MEHGNFYTAEALRGLNAAYDAEYGITSLETDKVNGIIRCMDDTRKLFLVPQEGDLLEYFPQNGDYFPQAHIETAGKGRAAVCLSSRIPFCHMESGRVHYNTSGGPWTQVPLSGMIPAGTVTKRFQTWGRHGRCRYGELHFHTPVRSWSFREPNPLYESYTMKEWTKYLIENEWPAIGTCMPVWMSDYSNGLILGCNGNLVRWMHITPSKQDISSFDRLGLIMAMPAGDAEHDVEGIRWEHRKEVMRDAIIYNRNNPSILFYESGNNEVSDFHMAEMLALRMKYDPAGGRVIGSRNMNASQVAEYGGEMLYINKSLTKPMWMMEYCRDEGIRRYWDEWSYPYHPEGFGPPLKGQPAPSYNHNQDRLAVENVVRWNEYWLARPGTGNRVNSGGAKIIFSDTNTHYRGEKKYRTSGDVDAMRIAKDSYFAHQVMWDGWVDTEREHTYIVGHWNYGDGDKDGKPVMKPVYVVSTGDEVELFLNGKSLGKGQRSDTFLFTFNDVKWQQGELSAVSYKDGQEISRHSIHTVGKPAALRMRWVEAPKTFRADGHDIRIAEVEVVDQQGERCPLAHDMVTFSVKGQGEWLGGVSGLVEDSIDNRILNKVLPIEAGVCRVMVRSTTKAGQLTLTAEAKGFKKQQLTLTTTATPVTDGFYVDAQGKAIEADWGRELPLCTLRGETPLSPSFKATRRGLSVSHIEVPCNEALVPNLTDDNEYSNWQSDGRLENGWLVCHLEYKARVAEVVLRMQNFRSTSYPLEVTDGEGNVLWQGYTPKSLGYVYLPLKDNHTDVIKLRMLGKATVKEAFGDMTELAAKKAISTKPSKSNTLSILEIEFNENIQ